MSSSVLVESSGGPASHVLPLGCMLEASNWALPVLVSVFGLVFHAFFDHLVFGFPRHHISFSQAAEVRFVIKCFYDRLVTKKQLK